METNLRNIKFTAEEYEKTKFRFNISKKHLFIKPKKNTLHQDYFEKGKK